jgi:hypothetical protein
MKFFTLLFVALIGMTACQEKIDPARFESWMGKWNGVEGTFLEISAGNPFTVTIANLDGPRTFDAAPKGDALVFQRDGKEEKITAVTGEETGMKYLLDKKDCLVVVKGSEGFCRD